ncbi:uncharacterized protein LOC143071016 [Mytilus galloprovincialis]|uniref:uncharacterized protein LOC143071016 n=1 Tax=Mytilus galloprovincialis TaxID=29158 RepID=UPI003F7CCEB7
MCNFCKETVHQGLQCAREHDVVSILDISRSPLGSNAVSSAVISSVISSYETALPSVQGLMYSDDDLLYMSCCSSKSGVSHVLFKGKLLRSSIKILHTLKRSIFDIALKKDGGILFKETGVSQIQLLSPAGEVSTVLDTSPMKCVALHVNNDSELIVGLRDQEKSPFPVKEFSVRQVIILGKNYQRKVTLEFDKKKNRLFTFPIRIRTDSKNIIYVIDRTDINQNGRIVAVDINGRVKFIYDGSDLENFKPSGITISHSDFIVVVETARDELHVINSKGDLVGRQSIFKDFGIKRLSSVCFDNEQYLLIGTYEGKTGDNGKIYVVKMVDSLM